MSSLSIDEKMSLIQKMRNQSQTQPVHPYIQPRTTDSRYQPAQMGTTEQPEHVENPLLYLKLRFFVCLLIFSGFFALYKTNFKVKGHSVTEVNTVLQENILPESLHNSLETMSQKLTDAQIEQ